jgi:hypothetical protein
MGTPFPAGGKLLHETRKGSSDGFGGVRAGDAFVAYDGARFAKTALLLCQGTPFAKNRSQYQ